MARRVYFAFHYEDVVSFRANVIRQHWLTKDDREDAGFFDASIWESTKKTGVEAIKKLIHNALDNTSVTVVLIGTSTYARRWVRYEIIKSIHRGNGIFGVHINNIKDKFQQTKLLGPNPFDYLAVSYSQDGTAISFLEWNGNQWQGYNDMEGYAFSKQRSQNQWGKSFKLSDFYKVYDWNGDDGYNNFADWVEAVAS